MKYIFMLLLVGCGSSRLESDPGYIAGDVVPYKIAPFYKNVCSGKATVISKDKSQEFGYIKIYYKIKPSSSEIKKGCPKIVWLHFKGE